MKSEISTMHFSYTVTLKYIGLSGTLNKSLIHAWFCKLLHWSFGIYLSIEFYWSVDLFHYIVSKIPIYSYHHWSYQKSCYVLRSSQAYGDRIMFSKILVFTQQLEFYHCKQICLVVLLKMMDSLHFLRNCLLNI